MKLAINREEKKGMLGRAYFLCTVKVTISDEERRIASERRLLNSPLIGSKDPSSSDAANLLAVCGRSTISLSDLTNGVNAKAEGNQIGLLQWLEESVREKCKIVKINLEMIDGDSEEEI